MGVGAWILLITVGLGVPAALVYLLLLSIPASATKSLPTRPVWMVLLDEGTLDRERSYSPDEGPDDGSNPQAPLSPQGDHEIGCREQETMPEQSGRVGGVH